MSLVLSDLIFEEGTTNMGGTAGFIYAIPASDVESIEVPAKGSMSTPTIKFKVGKNCVKIYATADTGEIKDTEVGDKDAGSFTVTLEFWTPRISEAVLVLKSQLINGGFIFIVKDANGIFRIIGSKDHPAYRTPGDISTGKAPKDKNGATFKLEAASATPALIYTGTEEALTTAGV